MHRALIAAVCFCLLGLPAAADGGPIVVAPEGGEVLVNAGSGFVTLSGPAQVVPGASVMVRPGGAATVRYSATCSARIGAGRVWTIQPVAPCIEGRAHVDFSGQMGATSDPGMPTDHYLLIGAGVVGAGVGIYYLTKDDDDKPASP